MGYKMNIVADPERIVAVLGGMFPHEVSWLEKATESAAKKLQIGGRSITRPTVFFDEDDVLVGKLGFTEESGDGKKVIVYAREIPIYDVDGNDDNGFAEIRHFAKNPSDIDGESVGVLLDYLNEGPYRESLLVRHYEDPSVLHAKSRFDFDRKLVLKGNGMEEILTIRVGVDQESLYDFVKHLHQIAGENPEAAFFEKELMNRRVEPLGKDIASAEINAYSQPNSAEAEKPSYAGRIANLAVHVMNF